MSTINPIASNAIFDAQQKSAVHDRQIAETDKANAASFAQLEAKGIKVTTIDFAQIYKDKISAKVDTNGDGNISLDELAKQIEAGGGSETDAQSMYKAMDIDGDGTLSTKEFKDSLPVSTEKFIRERESLLTMIQNGQAPATNPFGPSFGISDAETDPVKALSDLRDS